MSTNHHQQHNDKYEIIVDFMINGKTKIECDICDKHFTTTQQLINHANTAHNMKITSQHKNTIEEQIIKYIKICSLVISLTEKINH